jgi:hypothetical protein
MRGTRVRSVKRKRSADGLALATSVALLACAPDPPSELHGKAVSRQEVGEPSWVVTGRPSVTGVPTLLSDARVLIALGQAEIYEPTTGRFTSVETPLAFAQYAPPVLLRNGNVAHFGNSIEFFDPIEQTTELIHEFGFNDSTHFTDAELLPNGNVLTTLSSGACDVSHTCLWVFDVTSRAFGPLISIEASTASAVALPDGMVLVTRMNVRTPQPAVLVDPETREIEEVATMQNPCDRPSHALMPDGRVLFCCSTDSDESSPPPCEYYDPRTKEFVAGPTRSEHRSGEVMVVLPSGAVFLIGGHGRSRSSNQWEGTETTEVLAPGASEFVSGPSMAYARQYPSAVVLPSGKVLVGGLDVAPLETLDAPIFVESSELAEQPGLERDQAALPDGSVLVCGYPASTYDPLSDTFETLDLSCSGYTLTPLPSGRVLAIHFWEDAHAELIDPDSQTVERIPALSRLHHTATILPSGDVLLAGGHTSMSAPDSGGSALAEIFFHEQEQFRRVGAMTTERGGGVAALLGSGKVLIAGGTSSAYPSSSELFDPQRNAFFPVSQTPEVLKYSRLALPLPSGDVLVGADGGWAHFSANDESFEALAEVLDIGSGVELVTGDRLVCGMTHCARYEPVSRRFIGSFQHDGVPGGLTATGTGIVTAISDYSYAPRTMRFWPFPPLAVRPTLDPIPGRIVAALPVTLTGSRFTRPSAVGTEAMPPFDRHPLVAFMPVSGGGPIFSPVTEWSDTTLSWLAPQTPFQGGGWVHVIVDGVPSLGRFTVLDAGPSGVQCSSAVECDSGYCTEGVCCNRLCNGECESCLAKNQHPGGADGTCAPIAEGLDPKLKCTQNLCGAPSSCDGYGSCVAYGETALCAPYVCYASRCLNVCNDSRDCAAGYGCNSSGSCSRCTPEGDGVERGNSDPLSCGAYRCEAGQCKTFCGSRSDCASGHRCNDGRCVPGVIFETARDPGACSLGAPRAPARSPLFLVPFLALAARRRHQTTRRARS